MPKKLQSLSKNIKALLKEGNKLLVMQDLSIEELQGYLEKRDVFLNTFQKLQDDSDTHEFKEQLSKLFLQGEAMLVRLLQMSDELAQSISDVARQRKAIEKYKFPIVDTEQYTGIYVEDDTNGNASQNDLTNQPRQYPDDTDSGEIHHTDCHC